MGNYLKRIPKHLLLTAIWISVTITHAQRATDFYPLATQNTSTLLGIGQSELTDTYLSPLKYKGLTISFLHENFRPTRLFDGKLIFQQQFQLQTAFTQNPTLTASEYFGKISYNIAGLYPFAAIGNLKLLSGGGADASLGGIYNARNSNNPGSLKSGLNLNLTGMAIYNWRRFTFRYQVSTPFLGIFFSPAYGQSYYEIFTLGNNRGVISLASLHNQLALQNYFTIDFPIENLNVRAGYLGSYSGTRHNSLKTVKQIRVFIHFTC